MVNWSKGYESSRASLKLTATSTTDPDQRLSAESAIVQWQTALDNLMNSSPSGPRNDSGFVQYQDLGEHFSGRLGSIRRCSRSAETCQLRAGARASIRPDGRGISAGQER